MIDKEIKNDLELLVSKLAVREGFEVFEFKTFYSPQGFTVRILVDFPEGGITIEDCAFLNRKISSLIEKRNLLDSGFNLEVSSPGVLKKYTHPRDLKRVKGRMIYVKTELDSAILEYKGKCLKVDDMYLHLGTKQDIIKIPISGITEAKEVF